MVAKLARKEFPKGLSPESFTYRGRPAVAQDDFGSEVGIADLRCVDQFGGSNANKYYHVGVVQDTAGGWWVYLEWGRVKSGRSWGDGARPADFHFWRCGSEDEARRAFQAQCRSKNVRRLEERDGIWVGLNGKDGYIVQALATRENGLPDAYRIKDAAGLTLPTKPKAKPRAPSTTSYHPEEIRLARDLVGGTQAFVARSVAASGGVRPTVETIRQVRDTLIPRAMRRIADLGATVPKRGGQELREQRLTEACLTDRQLQELSNFVSALVPRPDPGRTTPADVRARAMMLTNDNILALGQDLDTMESSLANEDFDAEAGSSEIDVDTRLNARVRWIDPTSDHGRWLADTFQRMSNNRHRLGRLTVRGLWSVERSDRDAAFIKAARDVAKKRKGQFTDFARLQPKRRTDMSDVSDIAAQANIMLAVHGTRAVNVGPILQTNLRLPRTLPGALITGAMFGDGIYLATDWRKSYGYTGHDRAIWTNGGQIQGRGFFMFLQDAIMGRAYRATSPGSWTEPPRGYDSIAAYPEWAPIRNDEHIVFSPDYQRIRYVVEGDVR